MRMKPSRNFLLGLCCMLALGYLYYLSRKTSLRGWGYKSLYDSQGFLLKLDGRLPLELMYKYSNLSEGACKPGFAAAKMTAIYPKHRSTSKADQSDPPFRLGTFHTASCCFGIIILENWVV
ncbi:CMP-N-acetylneuraminate-beta-1,4-galactoside alpha-2,3-sialyltransferase-like [Micropterus salmoides]|uniref:CMP-N-acetylneuraminate-beta-1,4-galactoside alpha-2,3-sialyltransferase-like n=1 Tax=Micropterus salmoides TaxID=27706 RepID=UPI0018ED4EE1|nr:CMP-N-acetylneuraminate-beta-1,4-galactoside alpha-2,3-sialyltransferase-like [Micropterus salmoides]